MWSIIGSEAIASGALTRGQLRSNYTAVYPDVYIANGRPRYIVEDAHAAWLWTRRTGIIAGRTAAQLYGADAQGASTPIDVIAKHRRRQPGIVIRDERIGTDEVRTIAGMPVTTPARTALDLARHLARDDAVAILDQLAAATGLDRRQATVLATRYRGARGVGQAWAALDLMDGGARSPKETALRLRLIDAGLPVPRTNIVLGDGPASVGLGMGWDDAKVAVSHHDTFAGNVVQRIRRQELIQKLGWFEIEVVDAHQPTAVVHRARNALWRRR
jgi:AbiEi antitoxin C-terminal domain